MQPPSDRLAKNYPLPIVDHAKERLMPSNVSTGHEGLISCQRQLSVVSSAVRNSRAGASRHWPFPAGLKIGS
jgi:hypothetical protein